MTLNLDQLLTKAEEILQNGDAIRIGGAILQVTKNLTIDEAEEVLLPVILERSKKRLVKNLARARKHQVLKNTGQKFEASFIIAPMLFVDAKLTRMYAEKTTKLYVGQTS